MMPASTPTVGKCSDSKCLFFSRQLIMLVLPTFCSPISINRFMFYLDILYFYYILFYSNKFYYLMAFGILSCYIVILLIRTQLFSEQKNMLSRAIVGGGCFWCIQAVLQRLKGVSHVESGYAGGKIPNPTYEAVCTGKTGHAEVVRIQYDNKIIPYHDLLYVFMSLHDPTTLNRQGNDCGTQYRSIIMYESEEERQTAQKVFQQIQPYYKDKIVTELTKATQFYPAQEYHQNYYNENPGQGYCRAVIKPKVQKLEKLFQKYLDKEKTGKSCSVN